MRQLLILILILLVLLVVLPFSAKAGMQEESCLTSEGFTVIVTNVTIKPVSPIIHCVSFLSEDMEAVLVFQRNEFPLPIGSYLDKKKSIFYWIPTEAFVGKYEIVFRSKLLQLKEKLIVLIGDNERTLFSYDNQTASTQEENPIKGSFDTPGNNVEVEGAIPVTGWALYEKASVTAVKIYRKSGDALVYIGDAIFSVGARPDVETLYPKYPNANRAGWGYMMLTYGLPNRGMNDVFILVAIATTEDGKNFNMGERTIYSNNAYAVNPFGTIDNPTQGGEISKSSYKVDFWLATPSTGTNIDNENIYLWINGVPKGNPTGFGLTTRTDLLGIFPEGNVYSGYYLLNTSQYENGVYSIAISAKDSAENQAGIGSRYVSINNPENTPPYFTQDVQATSPIRPGNGADLTAKAVDADNDSLTWNIQILSGGKFVSFQSTKGIGNFLTIHYVANTNFLGECKVRITFSDGKSSVSQEKVIRVAFL